MHKITDVDYNLSLTYDDSRLKLYWKEGEMFLSVSGILLNQQGKWYELPIKDLKKITIINEEPLKIEFSFESIDLVVTGHNKDLLKALRHSLMPFIGSIESS